MCFHRRRIPKHLLLEPTSANLGYGKIIKWFVIFLLVVTLAVVTKVAQAQAEGRPNNDEMRVAMSSPSEASTGSLWFRHAEHKYSSALHLMSEAKVNIKGMLVSVVLRQEFQNIGNEWVEGVYVFPLGETAAVTHMVMEIGERRIVASVKEKRAAQKIYQQAKDAGQHAALMEQERPNVFTQSIANIAPGETVTIELHFYETASYSNNTFRWRLPTTLTPRYIPGVVQNNDAVRSLPVNGWALPTTQVRDAERITPFMTTADPSTIVNPIQIDLQLDVGLPLAKIGASYHQLQVQKNGSSHHIVTAPTIVPMDRDFEISWQTPADKLPDAAVFMETVAGQDYALLMVLPPQQLLQQALPREVIFIIDTSGSMGGTSIVQAKASLQMALARLKTQDRFNVIEFNSKHYPLFQHPQSAARYELQQARTFVAQLQARGGTEMAPALLAALQQPAPEGYLKQVVFITDGSVGNEAELLKLIHTHLGDARLFTVGIGSAPNSYFMRKAADFGRGTFTFIGSEQEVAEKMQALFSKLESPVLSNIQIAWPAGINVEAWPQRLPDLYQGEPLLVSIKLEGQLLPTSQITVYGERAGSSWQHRLTLTEATGEQSSAGVAVRWARSKIAALLDDKTRDRHADEVRADVLKLALEHQLLSPYTSFVAVEEQPSRTSDDALQSTPVPNLIPAGQVLRTLGYPRTATSAWLQIVLGLLAFFTLLGLSYYTHNLRTAT